MGLNVAYVTAEIQGHVLLSLNILDQSLSQ